MVELTQTQLRTLSRTQLVKASEGIRQKNIQETKLKQEYETQVAEFNKQKAIQEEEQRKQQAYVEGYNTAIQDSKDADWRWIANDSPEYQKGYKEVMNKYYSEQRRYGGLDTAAQYGTPAEKERALSQKYYSMMKEPTEYTKREGIPTQADFGSFEDFKAGVGFGVGGGMTFTKTTLQEVPKEKPNLLGDTTYRTLGVTEQRGTISSTPQRVPVITPTPTKLSTAVSKLGPTQMVNSKQGFFEYVSSIPLKIGDYVKGGTQAWFDVARKYTGADIDTIKEVTIPERTISLGGSMGITSTGTFSPITQTIPKEEFFMMKPTKFGLARTTVPIATGIGTTALVYGLGTTALGGDYAASSVMLYGSGLGPLETLGREDRTKEEKTQAALQLALIGGIGTYTNIKELNKPIIEFKSVKLKPTGTTRTVGSNVETGYRYSYINSAGKAITRDTWIIKSVKDITAPGRFTVVTSGWRDSLGREPIYAGIPSLEKAGYTQAFNYLTEGKGFFFPKPYYTQSQAKSILRYYQPRAYRLSSFGTASITSEGGGTPRIDITAQTTKTPLNLRAGPFKTFGGKSTITYVDTSGKSIGTIKDTELFLFGTKETKAILGKTGAYTPIKWRGKVTTNYQDFIGIKSRAELKQFQIYDEASISKQLNPLKRALTKDTARVYTVPFKEQKVVVTFESPIQAKEFPIKQTIKKPLGTEVKFTSKQTKDIMKSLTGLYGKPTPTIFTTPNQQIEQTVAAGTSTLTRGTLKSPPEIQLVSSEKTQLEILSLAGLSGTSSLSKQKILDTQKSDSKLKVISETKIIPISRSGQEYKLDTSLKNIVVSSSALKMTTTTNSSSKSVQVQALRMKTPTKIIKYLPSLTTLTPPQNNFKWSKRKEKVSTEVFKALSKRFGKEITLGEFGTQTEAERKLKGYLKGTLAASGRVLKGEKVLKFGELKEFKGIEFRQGKNDISRIIQRRGYRLSARPEIREILGEKRKAGRRKKIRIW